MRVGIIVIKDYDVYMMDTREKMICIIKAAAVLFLIGYLFFNHLLIALMISMLSFFYPSQRVKAIVTQRKTDLTLQFKDALYSISSSLSAGRSLENALLSALKELQILYPDHQAYMIEELEYICHKLKVNVPIESLLLDLANRTKSEDIRYFAEVTSICKKSGGNLVEIMRNTAVVIREKIEIKQEIEGILARQKYEQKILMIMPFIFIGLLRYGSSGYLDPLYASWSGYLIMGTALLILILSYAMSRKILDIRV